MQNKSAIWTFAILLSIACVYQLSFTFVTSGVENDAKENAASRLDSLMNENPAMTLLEQETAFQRFEQEYLTKMNSEEVYPGLGFTYAYCKRNEINLGLDLQGGMNVTLQVQVKELIKALSDYNNDPKFLEALDLASVKQRDSQDDYVSLFLQAWDEVNPGAPLAAVFHNRENKEKFAIDATNEEIIQIIADEADAAVSRTEQVLRRRIDGLGVVQPTIQRQPGTGRIIVELPGIKDKDRVRKILQGTAKLEFWECYDNSEIYNGLIEANQLLAEKLNTRESKPKAEAADSTELASEGEAVETTEEAQAAEEVAVTDNDSNSLDALLGDETTTAADSNGTDSVDVNALMAEQRKSNPLWAVMYPAIYDNENGEGQFAGRGPVVGYAKVTDTAQVNAYLNRKDVRALMPRHMKFFWDAKPYDEKGTALRLYAISADKDGKAPLEGDVITNARVTSDPLGNPEISMSMNSDGAKTWKNITGEAAAGNPKKSIAIVLDNLVYSAPRVDAEIAGGQSSISGQFSLEEAEDLANVLKAGKLPAPAKIIEEAVVGPTLGAEAIQAGFVSFLLALLIVLAYMAFYYSSAGIIADLALLANLFFVMGVLSSLGATLTLPGIAGIVLTIGMSVDANVLIYERIREELRAGKGVRLAIVDGYKNAYSSIIDANITTLLTGIILYIFGTGPIKGFATTLIIGIATSLFAAIFITRLLFEWRLDRNATPSFASKMTENLMANANFQFVTRRKTFYMISGLVMLLGVGSLVTRQLNYGVDFTGGRSYIVRFEQSYPVNEVASTLAAEFINEDGLKVAPEVKTYGASNQVKVTTKFMIDSDNEAADDIVEGKLTEGLQKIAPDQFEIMSSTKVLPSISDDIRQGAVWAVLFSLIVIFLYIVLRFRKWQFGLGALIAMFHDVLIVLSLFSLLYGFMPFSLEIDQAFIAALLTVVGYSINDTVVVFDRIREYIGLHKRRDQHLVINDALNSTLSRTLNTSLSTLVVLLMIFFFGGEVIRGFVFALIIGIIVGTYSSLCVATPIVVDLTKKES
jgi:SecD/SecF fusion protein